MEKQITDHVFSLGSVSQKIVYLDNLKSFIDKMYQPLVNQQMTEARRQNIKSQLQGYISILFEENSNSIFQKPSQKSINEMLELLNDFEIMEYEYNDVGELDVSATISMKFKLKDIKFTFSSTECDNHGQETFDLSHDTDVYVQNEPEYFYQRGYKWGYDATSLQNDIIALGLEHVTLDDFALFLVKITQMEYHLYWSNRE